MSEQLTSVDKGIQIFKDGDFDQAVGILEDASRQYPSSYEAFVYLGAAYAQQGRHNAAIGALKRASEIKPDSPRIHYNLGQAYEAAGVPREAWFEYKKALELDPRYGLARGALISLSQRLPRLMSSGIEVAA
ncbi:MAG: tetratricopeptide repeat protein [Armatimonadota bacterium]|nr:tetratricopeptide repeat protein [bacterium]